MAGTRAGPGGPEPASRIWPLTADGISVDEPVAIVDPVNWSLRAARYRWAELLQRIFEVDPLACHRCSAPLVIVAVITDPAVITRTLVHRARSLERALLPASGFRLLPAPAHRPVASLTRRRPGRIFGSA